VSCEPGAAEPVRAVADHEFAPSEVRGGAVIAMQSRAIVRRR